jgi:hypothetical protein
MTLNPRQFFHATSRTFKPGDTLTPGSERRRPSPGPDSVDRWHRRLQVTGPWDTMNGLIVRYHR